jgi:NAD(P)H-dependent FMN reductase
MTLINAIMSRIITVQNNSMKKVLAFSGSFSSDSINHRLVVYASELAKNTEMTIIRLADFEAPIYRKELEVESGIPTEIQKLRLLFDEADAFIISTPEYNGSIPAGLKNTMDWLSRTGGKIFQDKQVVIMSASPGGRGGQSILGHLSAVLPFWGAQLVGTFSLPKFGENFSEGKIVSEELNKQLEELLKELDTRLEQT